MEVIASINWQCIGAWSLNLHESAMAYGHGDAGRRREIVNGPPGKWSGGHSPFTH